MRIFFIWLFYCILKLNEYFFKFRKWTDLKINSFSKSYKKNNVKKKNIQIQINFNPKIKKR